MAQEYKVTKISQDPPRKWDGQYGTTYYVKVKLEGHERAVEIGKKDPNSLKEGDTVYGDVIPNDGFPTDKFKAAQNPSGKPKYQPRDDDRIVAQWAIGQANTHINAQPSFLNKPETMHMIEQFAKEFYAMVDRVKGGVEAQPQKDQEVKKTYEPDTVIEDIGDEPINLDDIPF